MFNKYLFKETTPVGLILRNVYPGFFEDKFNINFHTPHEAWQIVASYMMLSSFDEKVILELMAALKENELFDEAVDCNIVCEDEPPYLINGHHRFVAALLSGAENIKTNYSCRTEAHMMDNIPLFGFMETHFKFTKNSLELEELIDEFYHIKTADGKKWIKSLTAGARCGEVSVTWEANNYLLSPDEINDLVLAKLKELNLEGATSETKFAVDNLF